MTALATKPETYRGWVISFGYGYFYATSPDYAASYEGEEDGWVDNGLRAQGRTIDELHAEVDEWFVENGRRPMSNTQAPQTVTDALDSAAIDAICDEAVKLADIQPGDARSHWRAAYHGAMLARTAMKASITTTVDEVEAFQANVMLSSNIRGGTLNHLLDEEWRALLKAALSVRSSSMEVVRAVRTVVERFERDEAQGYHSSTRTYALEMLKPALDALLARLTEGESRNG